MLIDSGASGNFITEKYLYASGCEMLASQIDYTLNPKTVKLADGSQLRTNQILHNINTSVDGKNVSCSFVILPELSNSYDAILGMPYLEIADPIIDFSTKRVKWKNNNNQFKLNADTESNNINTPIRTNKINNSKNNYNLNGLSVEEIIPTLHPEAQLLISEYKGYSLKNYQKYYRQNEVLNIGLI